MLITLLLAAQILLPDPVLTPGDANPVLTQTKVCSSSFRTGDYRKNLPMNAVYNSYKIKRYSGSFEVDHLISLQLGGSNDIKNLWPQSSTTQPLNSKVKDGLEGKLHRLVCAGKLTLAQAQKEISTDWIASFKIHICGSIKKTAIQTKACAGIKDGK